MVWKKVSNSDAGDSTHFGGDDVDKISETFNAGTQTDPINIKDENLLIVDPTDTSKKVRFDAVGITTSTTRVLTIPDADITVASTTAASTSVAGLMSAADKSKLDLIEASATADQTGAQIKTAYEAETNAFTDTLFSKLGAIEASATADQTNAEIRTAVGAATDSNVFTDANVTTLGNRAPLASPTFTGTVNAADITLSGNLTVNGTTSTINSTTLTVDDKNIEMGSVDTPSDTTANGGGITLKGATDKTIIWDSTNSNFTSNQDWNIASGKVFKVNNVDTLTATALGSAVVGSSLTSVGTIGTGVWQGTAIAQAYIAGDAIDGTKLADDAVDSEHYTDASIDLAHISTGAKTECISMAVSDNTTALAVGTVFTFYMPYAMTLTDIKASVLTAPTGAGLIVDVHDSGTTIMTTDKLDIDVSEFHTSTAGTQPALTDTALANNAKIEIIVDQVGSTVAGAGLVIYLIGYQT